MPGVFVERHATVWFSYRLQSIYMVIVVAGYFICGIYIGILPHIFLSTDLYIWHLMSIFVIGTCMTIWNKCCSWLFLRDMQSYMESVCGLQKVCSWRFTYNVPGIFVQECMTIMQMYIQHMYSDSMGNKSWSFLLFELMHQLRLKDHSFA